jgi:nicotinamide-nucleotide adenylyltransferase
MKTKTGCLTGRFNPPHKGHVELIKQLLKKVDKLVMGIGSSNLKNTKKNPFSGEERKQMLEAYLREENIDLNKVKIVLLPDRTSYDSAIKNLFDHCHDFGTLFTHDQEFIKRLKGKAKVEKLDRKMTGRFSSISSTKIRDAIANDKKWEHLTGKSVAELIKKFDGIERIKTAHQN